MIDPQLLQFEYSHYNEKARWALDYKQIPHGRTSYLPGAHALPILRLTGKTLVPVLHSEGRVIAGSANVLTEIERRWPAPALYPEDPAERQRALDLQTWLDDDVGPVVRRSLFAVFLDQPDYLATMFAGRRSPLVRKLYRAGFPFVKLAMKNGMGITSAAAVEDADLKTGEALDRLAQETNGGTSYLVGDQFSVADLTAASLFGPAANPRHPAMQRPDPMPDSCREWLERWEAHPGIAWVHRMYAEHRPPSAEVAA